MERNRVCFVTCVWLAFVCVDALAQTPSDGLGFKASFSGSSLACSSPQTERFKVPAAIATRAKLKARLLNLLHLSLSDDAKGIVNPSREKEIADLAGKLKKDKEWESMALRH